jgi:hypothetical protein
MPIGNDDAAIHTRVTMALSNAERAVSFLRGRQVFRGVYEIQQLIQNLSVAQGYATASKNTAEAQYLGAMINFYRSLIPQLRRPMTAPQVGDAIYDKHGALALADPLLPR